MKEALPTTFTGMTVLLMASLLSGAVMGGFTRRYEAPADERVNPFDVSVQAEQQGVKTITTEELKIIIDTGSHFILDARPREQYDEAHIPTAMSLPMKNFEEAFANLAPLFDPEIPVVTYCSGPFCDDGLRLILRLQEMGFNNAVLYLDGMEGWWE